MHGRSIYLYRTVSCLLLLHRCTRKAPVSTTWYRTCEPCSRTSRKGPCITCSRSTRTSSSGLRAASVPTSRTVGLSSLSSSIRPRRSHETRFGQWFRSNLRARPSKCVFRSWWTPIMQPTEQDKLYRVSNIKFWINLCVLYNWVLLHLSWWSLWLLRL